MKEYMPYFLISYDKSLTKLIMKEYGYSEMQAFQKLIFSRTYQILSNYDCGMWEYGYPNVMDMFKAEMNTGNPCNAQFLKLEA